MTIDRTYQLNTGGNTDFLNMLERDRLKHKKQSKTEAVTSMIEARGQTIDDENIHVGPSDYVPWQKDNKICFLRIESNHFGDVPMNLELRLSVEDSPNSAGVAIDSIRCLKLALDNGLKGAIIEPAAYFQKHPPKQIEDRQARDMVEQFIGRYGHKTA
jgi:myo-inositol-1-phosphate synthase